MDPEKHKTNMELKYMCDFREPCKGHAQCDLLFKRLLGCRFNRKFEVVKTSRVLSSVILILQVLVTTTKFYGFQNTKSTFLIIKYSVPKILID